MGELMQDALGVGLAATQVGVLHRVLVYKAYEDDPVSALVNPVLEWESEERETEEEGCLSLPGVHVEVERAARVTGARAEHARQGAGGRGGGPAGAGDPARDGPPGRCADPRSDLARGAPGCDARVAGGRGRRRRVSSGLTLCARSSSAPPTSRRPCWSAWRRARTVRRWCSRAPTARGAGAAGWRPRRSRKRREGWASRWSSRRADQRPAGPSLMERAGPEVLVVCAFGALIKEPLLSAYPLLNVHPSLLPRWRGAAPIERAIMAGDAQTGVSIMRLTEGLDSGPVCAMAVEAIGRRDTYGSLAERLQRLGGELLVGVLDEWERGRAAALRGAARGGCDVRGEDRRRGPPARPGAPGGGAGAQGARAAPPHRRAPGAGGRDAAGCARARRWRDSRTVRPRGRWR